MPSSHLILCRPLLLLPPIPPSIRVFSNESTLHMRWPKYWSFSFSIIPSKEHPGLISFRMDWLDLLAVQRTLKSLLQHHSSKASILRCSAFFTVQLSHPYMTTGKTIALKGSLFTPCLPQQLVSSFHSCERAQHCFLGRKSRGKAQSPAHACPASVVKEIIPSHLARARASLSLSGTRTGSQGLPGCQKLKASVTEIL